MWGISVSFIKKCITFTNKYFKEKLLKCFLIAGIIFILAGVVSFFVIRTMDAEFLLDMYKNIAEMIGAKPVVNDDGTLSFWGIFFNNLTAGVIISLTGFIPFLFLPVWYISINSALVGAVMAILDVVTEESVILSFVKYILPHGIFEIPAIILEGAVGICICAFLCRKIFGKAKEESLVFHLKGFLGVHIFYILPMLLIAAFIEAVILGALYF